MATDRNAGWPARVWAAVGGGLVALVGFALVGGGGWLAVLGGSAYYILAGAGVAATGVLLVRRHPAAGLVYAAVLAATLAWGLWEAGFTFWPLLPRLFAPAVLGLFVLLVMYPLSLVERINSLRFSSPLFRLGFASSRSAARQLVRHGHFTVNARNVDIPSFQVRPGDEIGVRDKSREMVVIKNSLDSRKGQGVPDWLELNPEKMAGRVLHVPSRASIGVPINEQLIVELYSK